MSGALERFKQSPVEISARADAYFHVLKYLPLQDVLAKADAWLQTETKFPKPAEWKAQIVRHTRELQILSEAESRDYLRAEALGYEDDPCVCPACVAAGLPDRAENRLRYAPLEDADGRMMYAQNAVTKAIVTPGVWLHGWGLVRWYTARASFWNTAYARCGIGEATQATLARVPFAQRLERVFVKVGTMVKAS